jgi:hypothetical protein
MLVARMTMDTSRMRLGQYQDDTKDTAQGTSDVELTRIVSYQDD